MIRVPLALTVMDYGPTDEAESPTYPGAPWSVRMSCKLLRMLRSEDPSWKPYLKALPSTPVSRTHGDLVNQAAAAEYRPLREEARRQRELLTDSWRRLDAAAHNGASFEEYEWAMFQVHSRTFGFLVAGNEFRIMVPVADLLNHAGDVAYPLFNGPELASLDHLSWRLVSPQISDKGAWEMQFRANRPVQEGEELFISYGKRSSDDFVLQYGFLPLANPWDDVILFHDLDEALGWFENSVGKSLERRCSDDGTTKDSGGSGMRARMREAASRVEAEVAAEPSVPHPLEAADPTWSLLLASKRQSSEDPGSHEGSPAGDSKGSKGTQLFESSKQLKLLPRGKIDRRLTAALFTAWETLGGLDGKGSTEAAAARLADVVVAVRAAQILSRFSSTLSDDFACLLRSGADLWSSSETEYYMKHLRFYRNAIRQWDDPAAWGGDALPALAGCLPGIEAASTIVDSAAPMSLNSDDNNSAPNRSESPGSSAVRNQRMLLAYNAHKKMVLWDVILAVRPGADEVNALKTSLSEA